MAPNTLTPGRGTPARLGFRMPAEWEKHEATWLGWPRNRSDWPGKFTPIPWVYGEIVRKLAPGERLHLLVESKSHEAQAHRVLRAVGVDRERVQFFRFPTNRGWTRDSGPMFVRRRGEIAVVKFGFNAWARYADWQKDNAVPQRAARALGCRIFAAQQQGRPFVLEGGSIEVNGRGTLLTTEECLLDPVTQVRNPGMGRAEIEHLLRDYLGVTNILWLGQGIAGDDTHGHIDDLCRFVNERTVVLASERNRHDPNYAPLQENRERLQHMRLEDGGKLDVIALPMPEPLHFKGTRLPASYANFYVGNAAVLVPTFNDPHDRIALGILAELITDRPVIGIHAVDLVWGFGTLHCLTQQQPAAE